MKKKNSTYIHYQKIGAENLNSNNKKISLPYSNYMIFILFMQIYIYLFIYLYKILKK